MAEGITFERVDLGEGVVYEGEIENGETFLFGKCSFQGCTYIGEFNQNRMEGIGKMTLENENGKIVSVGTFKSSPQNGMPQLNGYGNVHFFVNNEPEEFIKANGGTKSHEGQFVDGELHGQGTIYYKDGGKYEGGFVHGRMHGKGIRTKADGTSVSREYNNGRALL